MLCSKVFVYCLSASLYGLSTLFYTWLGGMLAQEIPSKEAWNYTPMQSGSTSNLQHTRWLCWLDSTCNILERVCWFIRSYLPIILSTQEKNSLQFSSVRLNPQTTKESHMTLWKVSATNMFSIQSSQEHNHSSSAQATLSSSSTWVLTSKQIVGQNTSRDASSASHSSFWICLTYLSRRSQDCQSR